MQVVKRISPTINTRICKGCGKEYQPSGGPQKYCTKKCREQYSAHSNYNRQQASKEAFKKYKLNLGCSKCGYNKCARALQFHHLEQHGTYESGARVPINAWGFYVGHAATLEELKRVVLLCANCHMEIHDELKSKSN